MKMDDFQVRGIASFAPDYMDPGEMHQQSHWTLSYFYTKGVLNRVGSGDSPWRVRPAREAHLYPPGLRYWEASARRGVSVTGAWLLFLITGNSELEHWVDNPHGYARFTDPHGILGRLLADLVRAAAELAESERWFASQPALPPVLRLLEESVPTSSGEFRILSFPTPVRQDLLTARANEFMRRHFARPIKLGDIARHLRVSSSHLSHSYVASTGETPAAALHRFRVQMAADLLRRGEPAKRAAALAGFSDPPHLSRSFRKHVGLSPRAFVALQRRESTPTRESGEGWDRELWRTTAFASATLLTRDHLDATARNQHTLWTLDAFLTPGVRFREGDATTSWSLHEQGWLRLYPPGSVYSEDSSAAARPVRSLSVCFHASRASAFVQRFGTTPRLIRIHDPDGGCTALMHALSGGATHVWHERDFAGIPDFHRLLRLLVGAVELRPDEFAIARPGRQPAWFLRVHRCLERDFARRLTRAQIARRAGVSMTKLSRDYSAVAGETVLRTLERIRIRHARELLDQGMHLEQVAARTGYASAESLSRAHKRLEGKSPRGRHVYGCFC